MLVMPRPAQSGLGGRQVSPGVRGWCEHRVHLPQVPHQVSGRRGRRTRPGHPGPAHALVALGLLVALLPGCSAESRQRWLPYFFDGVPDAARPEPPPTRKIHQDLQREVEALRRENADLRAAAQARAEGTRGAEAELAAERAQTWEEAAALLPRDAVGAVDWDLAVKTGVIRPRPGFDPGAPRQSVFDMDVTLARGNQRFFAAAFSHAPHTRWL